MKRFLLLSFFTFSAHAACDYTVADQSHPEIVKDIQCDKNFECLKIVTSDPKAKLEDGEELLDYSRENNCNDQLRITELFSELMRKEETSGDEPHINNSELGNSKTDLPVIPDAPTEGSEVFTQ